MFFLISSLGDYILNASPIRGYVREAVKALMFLIQFSLFIINYDLETMVLIGSLIMTALLSECFGRCMTQTFFGQKTNNDSNDNNVMRSENNENDKEMPSTSPMPSYS